MEREALQQSSQSPAALIGDNELRGWKPLASESAVLKRPQLDEDSAVGEAATVAEPYREAGHSSLISNSNKNLIVEGNATIYPYHLL